MATRGSHSYKSDVNVPRDIQEYDWCDCHPKKRTIAIVWPFLHYVCKECGGLVE